MKKKKKIHLTKIIVPFVIISIFGFTGLAIWLQYTIHVELSATLITCFYGFCTGELWMLASIRKSKLKNNYPTSPTILENVDPPVDPPAPEPPQDTATDEILNALRDVLNKRGDL